MSLEQFLAIPTAFSSIYEPDAATNYADYVWNATTPSGYSSTNPYTLATLCYNGTGEASQARYFACCPGNHSIEAYRVNGVKHNGTYYESYNLTAILGSQFALNTDIQATSLARRAPWGITSTVIANIETSILPKAAAYFKKDPVINIHGSGLVERYPDTNEYFGLTQIFGIKKTSDLYQGDITVTVKDSSGNDIDFTVDTADPDYYETVQFVMPVDGATIDVTFGASTFPITYVNSGGPFVLSGPASAQFGGTVEVSASTVSGAYITEVSYHKDSDLTKIGTATKVSSTLWTFTMPGEAVRVGYLYENYPSITYNSTSGATLSGASWGQPGNTITVTATPASGHAIKEVIVYDESSNQLAVTKVNDTTYTFVMPNGPVSVTALTVGKYNVTYEVEPEGYCTVEIDGAVQLPMIAADVPYISSANYIYQNGLDFGYHSFAISQYSKVATTGDVKVVCAGGPLTTQYEDKVRYIYAFALEPTTIEVYYPYSGNITEQEIPRTNSSYFVKEIHGRTVYACYCSPPSYSTNWAVPVHNTESAMFENALGALLGGLLAEYSEGDTVTFSITNIKTSYEVVEVTASNTTVNYDETTGKGSFIMPASNVVLHVSLKKTGDDNDQGGESGADTDGGSFNDKSDTIGIPTINYAGIVSGGIITVFNPTLTQLNSLAQFLYVTDWADAIYQGFRDLFVKPMDSVITVHYLPIAPSVSGTKTIMLASHNTNVSAPWVNQQYKDVDLGTKSIEPFWNSFLDYNPYTQIQLFLPFIGTVSLDTDIVMGKSIGIRYRIDVITGACTAYIYTVESGVISVFAEYAGHTAFSFPLSGADYSRVIGSIIQAAASVAGMGIASRAATKTAAGLKSAADAQLAAANTSAQMSLFPNISQEAREAQAAAEIASAKAGNLMARNAQSVINTVGYTAEEIMSSKASYPVSGSIAGGSGLLSSRTPFLLIHRPRQSLPDGYKHIFGYPSNIYALLSSLQGFTRVEQAELKNIPCTDYEMALIYNALKDGVYI